METKRVTAQGRPQRLELLPQIRCYGLALLCVAVALAGALLLQWFGFHDTEFPLFLFSAAVASWFGGVGAAVLVLVLSCISFDFFFVEPLYTLEISPSDLPSFLIFAAFTALVSWFSTVRHGVERDLLQARGKLEIEVAERTQQASLLNLTHDSIFVHNMNDVITYWNRGADELYGWTAAQAMGKNAHQLLQTVFPAPIEEIRATLLSTGRWEGELEKARADGTPVVVGSRWSLQRDEVGQPAAILQTENDITERRRREQEIAVLNEELQKRTAELEASNKELEAFAYSISHDLRAPLRHMAGFSELLQKQTAGAIDEKSRRYVNIILDSAKRMGNLIDDLLAFSRLGRADTNKTMINLEQLAKEVLDEVRRDAEGRNISWKMDKLPVCFGDRSMIRVVLVNLISNAVKFTRTRKHAEIEIGWAQLKRDEAVLFVRDNGIGFDMKYINKLFGVFQRLHPPEAFEGTGIGLATVQRIIHRHGGRVWAEGSLDKGATFYFSLPKSQGV